MSVQSSPQNMSEPSRVDRCKAARFAVRSRAAVVARSACRAGWQRSTQTARSPGLRWAATTCAPGNLRARAASSARPPRSTPASRPPGSALATRLPRRTRATRRALSPSAPAGLACTCARGSVDRRLACYVVWRHLDMDSMHNKCGWQSACSFPLYGCMSALGRRPERCTAQHSTGPRRAPAASGQGRGTCAHEQFCNLTEQQRQNACSLVMAIALFVAQALAASCTAARLFPGLSLAAGAWMRSIQNCCAGPSGHAVLSLMVEW